MEIDIKPWQRKDYNIAISFAVMGMNFNRYMKNAFLLKIYGRYFFYMELSRASQIIAAYCGDKLVGVLLADMNGESKYCSSFWEKAYVKLVNFVQGIFYNDSVNEYDKANSEMYKAFSKICKTDGEICFLAADQNAKINGIGTLLLREFEGREAGKRIYLYTDNNCTYQFYEHRGFERVGKKQICLSFSTDNEVTLSCYLYSKVCEVGGDSNV